MKENVNVCVVISCLALAWKASTRGEDISPGKAKQVCFKYHFNDPERQISWENAQRRCDQTQRGRLVSMESEGEWLYFKNITTTDKSFKDKRWYIGLKNTTQKWCWTSEPKTCLNHKSHGTGMWRWYKGEPSVHKPENCVEMYASGEYNNLPCQYLFSDRGYICEKRVDCRKDLGSYHFKLTTTKQPPVSEKVNRNSTDKQPTPAWKSTVELYRPTNDTLLPVHYPTDDSTKKDQHPNISLIVVAVLVALLVILLIILGIVLFRRRYAKSKAGNQESQEIDRQETTVPEQIRGDETQPLPNALPLQTENTIEKPYLYAVIDKTGDKATTNRTREILLTSHIIMPDDECGNVSLCIPSEHPETKDHLYENTNQADSKRKLPVYPIPYCARYKKPREHSDDTDGKEQHLYAVVDKARNKKTNENCGLVYSELDFKPSQEEEETEKTTKECFTVYSSIQEED